MSDHDRLIRLIHRYLDGDRSSATLDSLKQSLETEPGALDTYHRQMRLHAALVYKASTAGQSRAKDNRRISFPLRPILAAAASLLLAAGLWIFLSTRTPVGAAPVVASLSGEVRMAETPLNVGDSIRPGIPISAGPGATLTLAWPEEQTRVQLGGGSQFTVMSSQAGGKQLDLRAGRLDAEVAPQPAGRPMTFGTPFGSASVVGTRFTLNVNSRMARLDVTAGLVRLTGANDSQSANIPSGHLGVLGPDLVLKPYTSSVQYVEGSLLFADSFDHGLERWDVSITEPGKAAIRRRFSPADRELAQYVTLADGTVIIDPLQADRKVTLILMDPSIAMGNLLLDRNMSIEKDHGHPTRTFTEIIVQVQAGPESKAGQHPIRIELGKEYRHRDEHVIRLGPDGKAEREYTYQVNDRVLTRQTTPLPDDDWRRPDSALECSIAAGGVRTRVSQFAIRRLIALSELSAAPATLPDNDTIFFDDFESGTLGQWHSPRGDWSVVTRPDGKGKCLKLAWKANASPASRILTRYSPKDTDIQLSFDFIAPTTRYSIAPCFVAMDGDSDVPTDAPANETHLPAEPVTGGQWVRHLSTIRNRQLGLHSRQNGQLKYQRSGYLAAPYSGLGISALSITEDRDLFIDNVTIRRLDGVSSWKGRSAKDLLAAYVFNEAEGNRLHDVSGVDYPMDLIINKPELTQWTKPGLKVKGDGPALATRSTAKVARAFAQTGGISLEFWSTPADGLDPAYTYSMNHIRWPQGTFRYAQSYSTNATFNHPVHFVQIIQKKGRDTVLNLYLNGEATREVALDPRTAGFMVSTPFAIELPGAAVPRESIRPWSGEYHFFCIYGRPLTLAEIQANRAAGVPRLPAPE